MLGPVLFISYINELPDVLEIQIQIQITLLIRITALHWIFGNKVVAIVHIGLYTSGIGWGRGFYIVHKNSS